MGGVWGVVIGIAPPPSPCTGGGGGGTGAVIVTDSWEPREEREWEEFKDAMELWCTDVAPIVFLRTPVVGEC